jgi:hypothetical protein
MRATFTMSLASFAGVFALAAVVSAPAVSAAEEPFSPGEALDRFNMVWTSPSDGPRGSMPLGNGEVGLNLWVEKNGDLLFYVSRTDAWSECNRLLKLGRIRVSLTPNPFADGKPFRQELRLREGRVVITAGEVTLEVFVDVDRPVVHVTGRATSPVRAKVTLENWRTERRVLKGDEAQSSWTMREAPESIEVWESADVIDDGGKDAVVWHHRNAYSIVPMSLKHQSIEAAADKVRDPLVNRTFGCWTAAEGFIRDGNAALRSANDVTQFAIRIAAHSGQTDTADGWLHETEEILKKAPPADVAARQTAAWWNDFWNRSWIFVEGGHGFDVTRAYVLQRWIAACGGRGHYPIKFNGSIFTVDPKCSGGPDFNADWRRWGDCYWWQNTRLPYPPMLAAGDFEMMRPMFKFYRDASPLCKARAKIYHNVDGVYFPETMTIFGTYSNNDYGWDRKGHEPKEVLNNYWRYAWQQGLELVALMLDYYDYTGDDAFLSSELTPTAHDVLRYYDTRFRRDAAGKLVINPTQSIETYWFDVTNDTPSVAGLIAVVDRLLALPADKTPATERELWQRMKAAAPPLPLKTDGGKTFILPAQAYNPKRNNVENPELYAVSPFRLLGVGRPNLETGVETFQRRVEKTTMGWSIDGHCAALLGMADEARRQLVARSGNSNPNHRFPAMWGPNYDWVPDQDHGSNLLLTLQYMVIQSAGDKIHLLPAWPKDWNVHFKLHAPKNTVVEGDCREGKLANVKVTPAERQKDLISP